MSALTEENRAERESRRAGRDAGRVRFWFAFTSRDSGRRILRRGLNVTQLARLIREHPFARHHGAMPVPVSVEARYR